MLRPYGVWAVISPFNFPAALAGGPMGGALVAGNTVVLKPSHEAPLTALALVPDLLAKPGCPRACCHLVFGSGEIDGAGPRQPSRGGRHALHRQQGGGHGADPPLQPRLPEALHHGDGGQEPRDRHALGRPGRRRGRRPALGLRPARARSAAPARGSTCTRTCGRASRTCSSRRPAKLVVGDPVAGGGLPRARDPRPRVRHLRARRRKSAPRREGAGGGAGPCARVSWPTATSWPPPSWTACQGPSPVPRRAVRALRGPGRRVGSLDEAIELANRTEYGLTAGLLQPGADGESTPSWSGSRPGSST